MIKLKELKEECGTAHAAAIKYGVNPVQFARLLSKGAYFDYTGQVFIPSQTKLKLEEVK